MPREIQRQEGSSGRQFPPTTGQPADILRNFSMQNSIQRIEPEITEQKNLRLSPHNDSTQWF
jgi:hypothetical protein